MSEITKTSQLEAHEMDYWRELQAAASKVGAKLEAFSEMVTRHHGLTEGDSIDPATGAITRKVAEPTPDIPSEKG